jgi:uncharacterized membrane protein
VEPEALSAIFCSYWLHERFGSFNFDVRLEETAALLAICLAITFTMENVGSSTGLIFGHYHFEFGALLPHGGVITVIVGGVWFGMGYFS